MLWAERIFQRLPFRFGLCAVPAPGYRERANGGLSNVGNNGFSYSSSVSGSNGVYLNFNVTNLNPSNANSRAYGLQLRCLSAFIGGRRRNKGGADVRFFLFCPSGVSERCRAGSSGVSDGYGGSIVRTINSVTY